MSVLYNQFETTVLKLVGRSFMDDLAFDNLGFKELLLDNATGNAASGRLKEKFGAVKVRVVPSSYVSSEYTHSEQWVLTKEAWRKHRSQKPESL